MEEMLQTKIAETKMTAYRGPWKGINAPDVVGTVNMRLIEDELPNGLRAFWAITVGGNPAFIVEVPLTAIEAPMPKLKVIRSFFWVDEGLGKKKYLIELLENEFIEQFTALCNDMISALRSCNPRDAILHIKLRLEKWKLLLSSSRSMSLEEKREPSVVLVA